MRCAACCCGTGAAGPLPGSPGSESPAAAARPPLSRRSGGAEKSPSLRLGDAATAPKGGPPLLARDCLAAVIGRQSRRLLADRNGPSIIRNQLSAWSCPSCTAQPAGLGRAGPRAGPSSLRCQRPVLSSTDRFPTAARSLPATGDYMVQFEPSTFPIQNVKLDKQSLRPFSGLPVPSREETMGAITMPY